MAEELATLCILVAVEYTRSKQSMMGPLNIINADLLPNDIQNIVWIMRILLL